MFWQHNSPSPIFFSVGPLEIRWYGILVAVGLLAGYFIFWRLWHKSGREAAGFEQLVFALVIGGFIGARLADIFLFEWEYFRHSIAMWWQVWYGGLAIHGSLVAGLLIVWWYSRRHQDSVWSILDMLAPAVALGQAIGRWGNYFNSELFGLPTSKPWGIFIAPESRPTAYILSEQFQPVFLYESIALLVIFIVLWKLYHKNTRPGLVVLSYFIFTSLVRFILEFIRLDEQWLFWGYRSGLIISGAILTASIILLVIKIRKPRLD